MALIQLIVAVLATYRIANLLPDDNGPFFIFRRIREYISSKAMMENDENGFWANIDDGINCAHCCGLYVSVLVTMLVLWQNYYSNAFLIIFAIAGGQSLLREIVDK